MRPGWRRKRAVLAQALAANESAVKPLDALAALGGFEVATLVGAVLQAASERRVIVVDGFITSAAVLVAARLQPRMLQRCVLRTARPSPAMRTCWRICCLVNRLSRCSTWACAWARARAALAWPLLQSACAVLRGCTAFEAAGVATQSV